MKKINTLGLAIAAIIASGAASAASIDYRHEYKFHKEEHSDRIKIGGSSNGFYYSVEMKFQGEYSDLTTDTKEYGFWEGLERGDSEFDWGYKYKINKNWYLQPGMPITFSENKMTYKPQLRVGYKFSDIPLVLKARYRHEFQQYTDGDNYKVDYSDLWGTDGDGLEYDDRDRDRQKSKLTFNADYKYNKWQIGFEANYEIGYDQDDGDKYKLYDGDNTNYELNLKIGYKLDAWRPYFEIGDAAYSSSKDTRLVRTRVGITYSF